MFTIANLDELLGAVSDTSESPLIYSSSLYEKAKEKSEAIRKLKDQIKEVCDTMEKIEDIEQYISDCRAVTNFNLSSQIMVAGEKLHLMLKVDKVAKASNLDDEGIVSTEVLEKVKELKERAGKYTRFVGQINVFVCD